MFVFGLKGVILWLLAVSSTYALDVFNAQSNNTDLQLNLHLFVLAQTQATVLTIGIMSSMLFTYVRYFLRSKSRFSIVGNDVTEDDDDSDSLDDAISNGIPDSIFVVADDIAHSDNDACENDEEQKLKATHPNAAQEPTSSQPTETSSNRGDTDHISCSTKSRKSRVSSLSRFTSLGSTMPTTSIVFNNKSDLQQFMLKIHWLGCVIWLSFNLVDFALIALCISFLIGLFLGHMRVMYLQKHTYNNWCSKGLDCINIVLVVVIFVFNMIPVSKISIGFSIVSAMCVSGVVGTYWTTPQVKLNLFRDISLAKYTSMLVVIVIFSHIITTTELRLILLRVFRLPFEQQLLFLLVLPMLKVLTLLVVIISIRQHETMDIIIISLNALTYIIAPTHTGVYPFDPVLIVVLCLVLDALHVTSLLLKV